jgi:hypothetical protein
MQEGAQCYLSNLSNDLFQGVQSGKIKMPPDSENKQSKDKNLKSQTFVEKLALAIANNKQGGVIELDIIAAMTRKSISVIPHRALEFLLIPELHKNGIDRNWKEFRNCRN